MDPTNLGEHIHHQFDRELESLRNRVVSMGGLAERQVNDALSALKEQNAELAEYVIRTDHRVNAQEVSIDEDCTYILARRQPAAGDLRMVMAIIKTITDIERIGDESEKIAHISMGLATSSFPGMDLLMQQIDVMGRMVLSLLRDALDTFVRMDVLAAVQVARRDEDIDKLYVALLTDLIQHIKADPKDTEEFQSLIWVARSLERIGDHSKNICEYVIYLVKGKDVRHTTIDQIEQEIGA
ncbi:MAG: phosphate signaling complex protein PhoU [Gammaproteobacteria bacterium]|nr:phosphate signaling complex protein PhoU [Gammaproteobacteria bacterium]MDH3560107.1 phosphate signaling complex protein PhoU [Gammaproteobacteria bacterium]